jgi:hypothetical protein
MQQKHFKYLLLLGVALIWGAVLYRILNNINSNPNPPKAINQRPVFTDKDSSSYQPYTLLIDYADPFGADDESPVPDESSADVLVKETNRSPADSYVKPDISFIKYKGIISNSITHKKAAIISVNGKDELARLNKIVNNIKINAIKKDRIQVTYQDKKYWIKRQ